MEGLEVSVVRLSEIDEFNEVLRLDAEFFGKFPLHIVARVKASTHSSVTDVVKRIQHPIEIAREYEDSGLLTVMAGNVRDNFVSLDDKRFMPETARSLVINNRLQAGDVLMTRTGANFGNTAPWKHPEIEAFACADVLVFREPSIPTGYLSSYLSSKAGQALVIRGGYGMAQPHIAPSYLQNMIVPRFDRLEQLVDELVDQSNDLGRTATASLEKAEAALLSALGLAGWTPPEPVAYQQSASALVAADRMDAEYFDPRHLYAEEIIGKGNFETLGSLAEFVSSGPAWPSSSFTSPDDINGIPFVRIRNCKPGDIETDSLDRLLPDGVDKFDVAMARTGDLTIGMDGLKYFYAGMVCENAFVNQRVGWVRMQEGAPPSNFVQLVINGPLGQAQLLRRMTIANTVGHITLAHIRDIRIPIVSDAQQGVISGLLAQASASKARSRELLASAKRAVEIAIEDSEAAAMDYLAATERGANG